MTQFHLEPIAKVFGTVPCVVQHCENLSVVYDSGYEWANHSIWPSHVEDDARKVVVGGKDCTQKYDAALLNVSVSFIVHFYEKSSFSFDNAHL